MNFVSLLILPWLTRDADMQYLFILAIIVIIFIILVPITPIAILIFYAINNFKLKKYDHAERDIAKFWLTDEEKKEFKKIIEGISIADKNISKAIRAAEEAGITRNMDGQYSVRSNLGKQVREAIETNRRMRSNLNSKWNVLSYLPYSRWEEVWGEFASTMANKFAAKNACWVWGACVVLFAAIVWKNIWVGITRIFLFPLNLFDKAPLPSWEWLWILGITFATLAAAVIFFHIGKKKAERIMPSPPPEVTESNYQSWKNDSERDEVSNGEED